MSASYSSFGTNLRNLLGLLTVSPASASECSKRYQRRTPTRDVQSDLISVHKPPSNTYMYLCFDFSNTVSFLCMYKFNHNIYVHCIFIVLCIRPYLLYVSCIFKTSYLLALHCPHAVRSRVYSSVGCPSVCPSMGHSSKHRP